MSRDAIDVTQIDAKGLTERSFPGGRSLRVCIDRRAHESAWRQASGSVEEAGKAGRRPVEVGGLLFGDLWRDEDGPFLEIVAAVPAEHTRNEGAQMTFTPETWAQVNRIRDESYPQAKIVGWYHTHPNFGIFLSEMDQFIHRHSFPQPWTTALVLDPVRETEGFFIWTDGEPRLAPEYWVGAERRDRLWGGRMAIEEAPRREPAPSEDPAAAVTRATFALVSALSFLALLFLSGFVYMREVGHTETEKFVLQALQAQKADLQTGLGTLADLSRDLENSRKEARSNEAEMDIKIRRIGAGLANLAGIVELLERRVSAQQQVLDRLPPAVPIAPRSGEVKKQ